MRLSKAEPARSSRACDLASVKRAHQHDLERGEALPFLVNGQVWASPSREKKCNPECGARLSLILPNEALKTWALELVPSCGNLRDRISGSEVAGGGRKDHRHCWLLSRRLPPRTALRSLALGNRDDVRAVQFFQTGVVEFDERKGAVFSRIDGNHRLAASDDAQVRKRETPFCIVLCRNATEFRRFSSALFHNINYKQVSLPKEHNLRLILDDTDLFPDDRLRIDPSFGWSYYQARKLHSNLDLELLPSLKPLIESEPRSFLVDQFIYLRERRVLNENEHAIRRFKEALAKANALFDERPKLKDSRDLGLLAAILYYLLKSPAVTSSFIRWVSDNHLHLIHTPVRPTLSIFLIMFWPPESTRSLSLCPLGKIERMSTMPLSNVSLRT